MMDKGTFKEVGFNIQQVLKEKSLSQQALADALGISKQVMNKIVSGAKAINVAELSRIAMVLGTPVDRLLIAAPKAVSVEAFNFMGRINSEGTREKVLLLNDVIKEILLLEEMADAR